MFWKYVQLPQFSQVKGSTSLSFSSTSATTFCFLSRVAWATSVPNPVLGSVVFFPKLIACFLLSFLASFTFSRALSI